MKIWAALTTFCLAILGYHYLFFGLLMKMWAQLRPAPVQKAAITPQVTLIVAAYNETAVIRQKVENSLALDYPPDKLEILFVTDGSDDDTPNIVREFADKGVQLLHQPEREGKSAAINRAAEQATGEIFVFSDANAFYLPDVLQKLVRNFADASVGCVSGNKTIRQSDGVVGQSAGVYWRYESAIKRWESAVGSTVAVVGEMLAIRRTCFAPIPAQIINDDAFLAMQLLQKGMRVLYEPEAVCWETAVLSTEDESIRRRRINAGRYQLMFQLQLWPWQYPLTLWKLLSHKFLRLLLPFFMIVAFISNTILLLQRRASWLLKLTFLGQGVVYLLALLGALVGGNGRLAKLPTIAYYIVNGNLTSLQGFVRFLSGKQTVLWAKAERKEVEG